MNYLKINLNPSEKKRLFDKIIIDPVSECWNWTHAKDKFGYGYFRYKQKTYRVHRFVYAHLIDKVPTARYGKGVPVFDHLCKNKSCCNPKHLELVPQSVNLLRSNNQMTINLNKTHCIHGHLLPEPREKLPTGKLGRRCITCRRRNALKRYYKNKEK